MRRRDPADSWTCTFCGRSETRAAPASACLCAECAERSTRILADRWRERAEGILLRALRQPDPTAGGGRTSGGAGPLDRRVWRGHPFWYRRDTSDLEIIREVLSQPWSRGAYWVPAAIKPRVILDVGGHIGVAAVYLASLFPDAKIYTFEPVPDNFALLSRNIGPYPNIEAFPIALGKEDGVVEIWYPEDHTNLGGFSFFEAAADRRRTIPVEMRHPRELLTTLGITRVDVVKIDAEGAEYDVLTGLDPALLKSTGWITGELHGERDAELLDYLSRWFDLSVTRSPGARLSRFEACNKALAPGLSSTRRAGRDGRGRR